MITAETLAQMFHETYERLAPEYGYETREASRTRWADVPEANRHLMVATCEIILQNLAADRTSVAAVTSLAEALCVAGHSAIPERALLYVEIGFGPRIAGQVRASLRLAKAVII